MHSRPDSKFVKISENIPLTSEDSRSGRQLWGSKELNHVLCFMQLSALSEANVTVHVHKHTGGLRLSRIQFVFSHITAYWWTDVLKSGC